MLIFPDRLRVSESTFTPVNQSITGGQAISGFQQSVTSPRGRWMAKVTLQVVGEDEILAYNGFLAALQGSGNLVLVTPRDGIRPRDAANLVMPWRSRVPWANGARWFSGGSWRAPPRSDAALVGAAAQGATALTMRTTNGRGVRPGHYIGFLGRLYRVVTAHLSATQGAQDLTVWPRLRTAAPAGAIVNLASPVCTMRLMKDDSGPLTLKWREPATPTLEFIESFPAPGA